MSPKPAVAANSPPVLETVPAQVEAVEQPKAAVGQEPALGTSSATASAVTEKDGEVPTTQAAREATPVEEAAKVPAVPLEEAESVPAINPSATSEKNAQTTVSTPLAKLFTYLPSIIEQANHSEMWGVTLADESHVPTSIVLEKFLRANDKDVSKATAQLTEALKWRKRMEPLKLLADTEYDAAKFGNLGYVTTYQRVDGKGKEIITWNIYGAVKDLKATFGNIKEFIKWRCALMELSVKELDLASATVKIPEDGPDPYRMIQVHDYLNVSFLRMDPAVRAASKETIQTFSMAYPELLKEKFFVNVPLVMGWVFAAMKIFLSEATVKKFHPLSYGSSLTSELPEVGDQLSNAYGGKGKDVKEGLTVKYSGSEVKKEETTV